MTYCEYCGQAIETGSRYCSSCGAPAPAQAETTTATATSTTSSNADPTMVTGSGDYSLVLISLGTCTKAAASDLLEDTLGYTDSQSEELFSMLPAQVAQQLTQQQATYLAQAMTEYGMEVSASNANGYISLNTSETESVYDSNGSFLGKVASVLGVITGINRMRKFRKLYNPVHYAKPYRPETYHPQPPKHVRRPITPAANIRKTQPNPQHAPQPGFGSMSGKPHGDFRPGQNMPQAGRGQTQSPFHQNGASGGPGHNTGIKPGSHGPGFDEPNRRMK
ncbi:MAG: zinc ribbon domain-containing protein [Lachnospiraceae bacterium]|nr:zinc ribbon domain-containing protein [Lachnospiraceae bacterium]